MINITDIEVNNHKLWSPKNPFIYDIKIILEKAEIVQNDTIYYKLDEVNEKFGFREFTVKKNKFYLNNEPIYLKAVFFEGLYPVKLSYPDSKEMMIKEILMAKKAGFNMLPTGQRDKKTAIQIILYVIWMIIISVFPYSGLTGSLTLSFYGVIIVLFVGIIMLFFAINLYNR